MRTEAMYDTVAERTERSAVSRELLSDVIAQHRIAPYFQPIVDLVTGELFGYEVLSRAAEPFEEPEAMFGFARECGLVCNLEAVCIEASLAGIAVAAISHPDLHFSFNVGPKTFIDKQFSTRLLPGVIAELGIDVERLMIEFTERETVEDYPRFERLVQGCIDQGFKIALDDFGSGYNGLRALSRLAPHFVKLDRSMIAGIEDNAYVQNVVKAVVSVAASSESQIIAEGIETESELVSVIRLGVRYAQGDLLGRPESEPRELDRRGAEALRRAVDDCRHSHTGFHRTSVGRMINYPRCFQKATTTCAVLEGEFLRDRSLDHVVLLDGSRALGVITRRAFFGAVRQRHRPQCDPNRLIDEVAMHGFLSVDQTLDIRTLIRLAMDRRAADLYDPIVVSGGDGVFAGTITVKTLFAVAMDVEVEIATSLNPLTRLPGNIVITHWLEDVFKLDEYAVVYADLSRFKEFNERYGFVVGDDLIRATARLFVEFLPEFSPEAKLGHIGGDDFIVVSDRAPSEATLAALCVQFDARRNQFFAHDELDKGWYSSIDRSGKQVQVPLVTVTLAVVTSENFEGPPHPALISQIAMMLKRGSRARGESRANSRYLFERRRHTVPQGVADSMAGREIT